MHHAEYIRFEGTKSFSLVSGWIFWPHLSLISRIAFDILIVSPFRSSNLGQGSLSAAEFQAEYKRIDHETVQRYHSQGIGFEVLLFEYSGDLESEGDRLLISVCRAIDDNLHRKTGSICQILKERISFVIQKYGHICLQRARDQNQSSSKIHDRSIQLLQIYSERG